MVLSGHLCCSQRKLVTCSANTFQRPSRAAAKMESATPIPRGRGTDMQLPDLLSKFNREFPWEIGVEYNETKLRRWT